MNAEGDNPATKRPARRLVSRRHLVGAVGAGLAAGALGQAEHADAATGTMQYGAINDAGDSFTSLTAAGPDVHSLTLRVSNTGKGTALAVDNTDPQAYGATLGGGVYVGGGLTATVDYFDDETATAVDARSDGPGTAVEAHSEFGVGVRVSSAKGRPLVIVPSPSVFNPPDHAAETGTIVFDTFGTLSICLSGGNNPTWRTIFHPSGGAFHPINPVRPYDSRDTNARLASGQSRLVEVGTGRDENGQYHNLLVPYGISAVAFNLTITKTLGSGYLSICAGNKNTNASIINWTGPNQTIANASVIPVDSTRHVKISCNGGGSTHFILDINGYYR